MPPEIPTDQSPDDMVMADVAAVDDNDEQASIDAAIDAAFAEVEADVPAVNDSDEADENNDPTPRPAAGRKSLPAHGGKTVPGWSPRKSATSAARTGSSSGSRSKATSVAEAKQRLKIVCKPNTPEWEAAMEIIEEEMDNVNEGTIAASRIMRRVKDSLARA
jgi:hypothetical protein